MQSPALRDSPSFQNLLPSPCYHSRLTQQHLMPVCCNKLQEIFLISILTLHTPQPFYTQQPWCSFSNGIQSSLLCMKPSMVSHCIWHKTQNSCHYLSDPARSGLSVSLTSTGIILTTGQDSSAILAFLFIRQACFINTLAVPSP